MKLTLKQIAQMCDGQLALDIDTELIITNVTINSKDITDNSLFIAIIGSKYDGHNFVTQAKAAIVNISYKIHQKNLIYVADTAKALGIFAQNYRKLFNIPVVAITGSNGKTTVKEMLKSICIAQFGANYVQATCGNLNNHLGLPLTILKLEEKHKVLIVEMGMNHSGELTYLSSIAMPTIAIVTNVMFAHAGFFNSLTEIAYAKGEIFTSLNGIACINYADKFHHLWLKDLKNIYFYNTPKFHIVNDTTITTLQGNIEFKLQVLGKHNLDNALAASALALNLNCSLQSISFGLSNYQGYSGRLEQKKGINNSLIIDDSYNANPDSVKAAIEAIKDFPRPHWFIMGDLKELGSFAIAAHQQIGKFAATNNIDCLLTLGELTTFTNKAFYNENNDLHFINEQDIVEYCLKHLPIGATLLVKGSRSTKLDAIINKLKI